MKWTTYSLLLTLYYLLFTALLTLNYLLFTAHTKQTLDEVDESAQEWEAERASFRQRCERWAKEGEERESRHAAQEEWMRLHV